MKKCTREEGESATMFSSTERQRMYSKLQHCKFNKSSEVKEKYIKFHSVKEYFWCEAWLLPLKLRQLREQCCPTTLHSNQRKQNVPYISSTVTPSCLMAAMYHFHYGVLTWLSQSANFWVDSSHREATSPASDWPLCVLRVCVWLL